ncbi:MAG: 1-acyl-sn-glycerol-3-phosphate acyltransferase, partial [Desulfobacterales bacterium]|nr:1-acyl-sn-glycerol-3-phosphate acyltransferase [Desulfobacterales bacterium]
MKHLKSIWHWFIGGIFFLFIFFLLSISLFTRSREKTLASAAVLFRILLKLMGVRLQVQGLKKIDPEKSYLILGNHQSLFDLFVIPASIPLCFTQVEAAYHFSLPIWGFLMRKWGAIPIERENIEKAKASIELAR